MSDSDSPLHVIAVITAKPDLVDELGAALAASVAGTRAEDGCLDYRLYSSLSDPTAFVTVERWRSQADLDAHVGGDNIRNLLASAGHLLASPPTIHPLAPIKD